MSSMLDAYTRGGRSRKQADKHKTGKSKSSSSSPPVGFLFVVNKLDFYRGETCDINRDTWHNTLPPRNCLGYEGESPSRVMRYEGGQVTEACGYQWYRPMLRQEGYCLDPTLAPVERHSHAAVFSCNPHLPVVVIPEDPTTLPDQEQTMHALHFFHPLAPGLKGVSQATTVDANYLPTGGGPLKYVAGRNPSWMPGLVPQTYAYPGSGGPPSRGLGGHLPIVLGLMAFSGPPDQVYMSRSESGHRGFWRDGVWTHNSPPALYPKTDGSPRGFYVAVFYDPENPDGSMPERIRSFEWDSPVVGEYPPGSSSSSSAGASSSRR
ncbi:hypothetical protein HRG_000484 [Hirsutella rhossiliensis]|uniref:Uncharacterized protein n=1 Tax=Hirsutella rhossiliensis TaxID=111463 RepID=A0A9P8NAZ9_9HYPO|nr:uncharacterized protein HRG_00484 [Hirsutella rhossiliensis]KAH0967842.1 hypothetical protein HRG_00484 [Hirsutella rhossiliensis]